MPPLAPTAAAAGAECSASTASTVTNQTHIWRKRRCLHETACFGRAKVSASSTLLELDLSIGTITTTRIILSGDNKERSAVP